jgi:hypothetical protein
MGFRRFCSSGRNVRKPGQHPKINRRDAFLLNRLHVQGIIPDRAGLRTTARKDAEKRYDTRQD